MMGQKRNCKASKAEAQTQSVEKKETLQEQDGDVVRPHKPSKSQKLELTGDGQEGKEKEPEMDDSVKEALTCCVCIDVMRSPTTLNCGHR